MKEPDHQIRVGRQRDLALQISVVTRHQYYYEKKGEKRGRKCSTHTLKIKYVWVEQYRKHAYVLTILDTFTRSVLAWHVAYRIIRHQVKQLWEEVIPEHLQPADMLTRGIRVELRTFTLMALQFPILRLSLMR